jgi:hypothetical protein
VLNKWKNDFHTLFQRNGTRDIGLDNSEFNTEIDVSLLNGPIIRDEVLQAVLCVKLRKAEGIDIPDCPLRLTGCNYFSRSLCQFSL